MTEHGPAATTAPAPTGPGVRVTVTSSGICGSDLHSLGRGASPVVLGHEFGGRLDDGSLVAVQPNVPCRRCRHCAAGQDQLCAQGSRKFYGATRDGGLADVAYVDEQCLVPVEGVPADVVGLVEPLAVAVHAVNRAGTTAGQRALVVGGGSIGLLCAAVLRDRGVQVDIAVRHNAQRHAADALGLGLAPGGRYALVVDAAGSTSSMAQAVGAVQRGGRIVLVALPWEPVVLPFATVLKEVSVVPAVYYGHFRGEREFAQAAGFLAAHPDVPAALITHRFGLDDAAEAFRVAADRRAGAIKVLILP